MGTIVVGVDESADAAAALRWAIDEGRLHGATVRATMCWGYLDQHHVADSGFDPDYGEDAARAALETLVAQATGLPNSTGIDLKVVNDLPARGLLEDSSAADLLVLGARGIGAVKEVLVGSVSRQCLHHSTVPVIIVRKDTARPTFGRIVVGIDGSAAARRALDWALDEARARKARVVVVHCWARPLVGGVYALTPLVDVARLEDAAHALVTQVVADANTDGLVPIDYTIVAGRAGEVLVSETVDSDLVVVGSRGLGGFRELLLGSTSHHVTHHAPCPVAVIPPERERQSSTADR
jgi:nucleotide-binding universal stress UspA family protein